MLLTSTRDAWTPRATLSTLTIDGQSFAFALEDRDRGLEPDMTREQRNALTVPGETCITPGIYELGIRFSPSQEREVLYLKGVPGNAEGRILIHAGNKPEHTRGCLLVGMKRDVDAGTVARSQVAIDWLEKNALGPFAAIRRGEEVRIEIRRDEALWAAVRGSL